MQRVKLYAQNEKERKMLENMNEEQITDWLVYKRQKNIARLKTELENCADEIGMCDFKFWSKVDVIILRGALTVLKRKGKIKICDEWLLRFGGGNQNV